ncbi:MAG: MarR family transcriptional regulator [Propionibacteriales bacterium]|nr:MarR family transcriptional regulator [Propionibacteriales bacterium]
MDRTSAESPHSPTRLAELPSWLVSQVAGHAHRLVSEALAQYGVRKHHFTVLLALAEQGPGSQAMLGRSLCIDRSDLHAVLNDLERDGLVARARDDGDRRRNVVEMTTAGGKTLARLDARVAAAQEALLEPLSDDERRELRRTLTRLVEHHRGPAS